MSEPKIHVVLQLPAELAERDPAGEVLRAVCRVVERTHACEGVAWRVTTAFNEAFTNVVEHAYAPDQRGRACIEVTVDAARLVLEVREQGRGFDLAPRLESAPPDIERMDRGGMGIFIIRSVMTSTSYVRGTTNRLRMVLDLGALPPDGEGSKGEAPRC